MLNELFILSKIKEGDIKAFEEVFHRYYSPLCWYAAGMFYVFWRERENLQIFCSVKSYLYGAVRNEVLQYCEHREVRNRYREAMQASGESGISSGPEEQMEYKELEELINRTLEKLPERRRCIFKMHRMEGKKYAEIASLLTVSVKTVEAEMTKALKTLRKEVEKYIE